MYIRILNKNLETDDNYNSAKTYEIAEGAVFTYTKNETLDSATVVIENQTERIKMSPYDIVEILNYTGQRLQINNTSGLMCIDTYIETMTCVNPKIYRYEITLFSETKQLEGIVLPNLKITKVWGEARSIYYYINQYMLEYCPYIRIKNGNTYSYQPKWKWDDILHSLQNKFSMQCPEMQWNTPTLREVLNDLMMVADCIPVLNNGMLSFMDLTEVGNTDWTNDTTHINYVTRSKSSEDYVSELQVKLENVTNQTEGVNNLVTMHEYVTLKTPDEDAILTTNNMIVKTHYPIYKLKSLKMMYAFHNSNQSLNQWQEIDLMNSSFFGQSKNIVFEYKEWITKDVLYKIDAVPVPSTWSKYQNWSLYYTRGSREIIGLDQRNRNLVGVTWVDKVLWQEIIEYGNTPNNQFLTAAVYYNLLFAIEYETLEGCLFRASKNDDMEHERVVIDNQTNSMVDSYSQGFLEYQKANRLGNEQLQINARFEGSDFNYLILGGVQYNRDKSKDHFSNHNYYGWTDKNGNTIYSLRTSPTIYNSLYRKVGSNYVNAGSPSRVVQIPLINIGETYEDSIIYQVQYQMFKNHIEVNALATKNYILREYFTGVKSKIRSWAIASGSEALTRHDLLKYYCEFSYNEHNEAHGLTELSTNNIGKYLLSPLTIYTAKPLKTCFVRTTDGDNNYPADLNNEKSYYSLDLMSRIVGNSLVFTFEFLDNYWAGKSFHTEADYNGESIPSVEDSNYIRKQDVTFGAYVLPVITTNRLISNTGVPTYQHRYTNDNGEFTQGQVIFGNGMKIIPGTTYSDVQNGDVIYWQTESIDNRDKTKEFLYNVYQRPRIYESNIKYENDYNYEVFKTNFDFSKDSQEITNISTQLEFSTETNDICFSKEFLKRQEAINTSNNTNNSLTILLYNKNAYNFRRPDELPDVFYYHSEESIAQITTGTTASGNLNGYISIRLGTPYDTYNEMKAAYDELVEKYCLYLTDGNIQSENPKPIMAFRNFKSVHTTVDNKYYIVIFVYLNILRTHNKNVYDENNRYLIVDKI